MSDSSLSSLVVLKISCDHCHSACVMGRDLPLEEPLTETGYYLVPLNCAGLLGSSFFTHIIPSHTTRCVFCVVVVGISRLILAH